VDRRHPRGERLEESHAVSPAPDGAVVSQVQASETRPPWVVNGIIAGLLGGAVVAVFFFVVDWLAGRPFWTPYALGSALFLAERVEPGTAPGAILILAYSVVHGVVFIAAGVPAASEVNARAAAMRGPGSALVLAAVFFSGFELFFLLLGQLFFEGLIGTLGVARVTVANGLAAVAMAAFLWSRARRLA